MPHLSLAIALATRIDAAAGLPANEVALLEAFRGAALVCDGAARLLGANAAARALINAGDGVGLLGGRLVAMNPVQTARLRNSVAAAALGNGSGLPQSLRLQRRPPRLALSLRLVRVVQLGPAVGDPCTVAIFIGEPDVMPPLDSDAVADIYGLAPREAEVACLLACGASPAAIAAATGLQLSSVRAYLRNVFDKTGARSQAALVALLRGFA
jgi:DNA-binding CsgD family transcriptional regulator